MSLPDRHNALVNQATPLVTGIDFVYVHADQVTLDVFFLTPPLALTVPLSNLQASAVRIHAATAPDVAIVTMGWAVADGRDVLRVTTTAPGGFVLYRLGIDDPRIDPFFNDVGFSFKANCPSPFDCEPPPHECPPEPQVDVPIDTLARDFWSLRTALLDFASQRYPDWNDRLEADVGVMLAEVLASVGDEMSYYQDRIAREAALETATQRRSLRRLARLVDYEPHQGRGAHAWLDVRVDPNVVTAQQLLAGTDVWALTDAGKRIWFEIGRGLAESMASPPVGYDVRSQANSLTAHIWDETASCLQVGARTVHVVGHHAADLPLVDLPPDGPPGRWLLLATHPTSPELPERRWLVRVLAVTDEIDPLLPVPGGAVTRLHWGEPFALPFEMDLETLTVHGNLIPATAGRTVDSRGFRVGDSSLPAVPSAIERTGPNGTPAYLFTLPDVDGEGLVWHGDGPRVAAPEIRIIEATPAMLGPDVVWSDHLGGEWQWRRSLLGTRSSRPGDRDFTLDDGTWDRAVGYQRLGGEIVHRDYLASIGTTIRFGDGEFGAIPVEDTWFHVVYRLGNGERGNVPADSIVHFDAVAAPFVLSVRNPLDATGGVEPERADDVKLLAPDAFRSITFRAVRPEDYAEVAQRLPWVQRANAEFRWTGSWLSAFVAADPRDQQTLSPPQQRALAAHVDRFRQAGREVHARAPRYADLDLIVRICVETFAHAGDVHEEVLRRLEKFCDPDRFTFGTPFDRSEAEAMIQQVPGVRAVEAWSIRRRGWFDWRPFHELMWKPAIDEVVRVDNDPQHPDRGSLRIVTHGGA